MDKISKNRKWNISRGVPLSLGAGKTPQGLSFAVEVPRGSKCDLVLYEKETGRRETLHIDDTYRYGNVLAFEVRGNGQKETEQFLYENYEYTYRIDGRRKLDAYARVLTGRRRFGCWKEEQMRCGFVRDDYDWQGDRLPEIPLDEVILYNLHVRGFTRHRSSDVAARGTFGGIIEKIPYLKQLGINQVELLPVYEFAETLPAGENGREWYREEDGRERRNYWGYSDCNYYFAVKQTFAQGEDASGELRELVRQLHANGIELVLEFYFPQGTGMGLVQEVLRYWALEYHIDGFHVTGAEVCLKELLADPLLADRKLYGAELFGRGRGEDYREQSWIRRTAVSNIDYMTHIRSFLKGDAGMRMDAAYYMRRNMPGYGYVNYITSHDGFTMYDLVSYDHKHNEANGEANQDGWDYNFSWNCGVEGRTRKTRILELRMRQMKNAWLMLLLSQGVPAIMAGDEWCNSQGGNNNAYCQDNDTGWVSWRCPRYFEQMHEFIRRLIRIRREHPVFHMQAARLTDEKGIGYPDISYHSDKAWFVDDSLPASFIGILLCGEYAAREDGTPDDTFYIACNMDWGRRKFALPDAPKGREWRRLLTTGKDGGQEGQKVEDRTLEVPPRTIVLLIAAAVQENKKHGTGKRNKRT